MPQCEGNNKRFRSSLTSDAVSLSSKHVFISTVSLKYHTDMLVGNSKPEYVFTRLAIWGLRFVAPASIAYSALVFLQPGHGLLQTRWLVPPHIWMFGEAVFYLGVYLPTRSYLQRAALHPSPPSRPERQKLFERVKKNISNQELYLSKWFMGASIAEIKRENLKEFFAWSLMNESHLKISDHEDAELEHYIDQLEISFGRNFEEGKGRAKSLRGTFDPVPMQHRPLLWYGVSQRRRFIPRDYGKADNGQCRSF